MDFRKKHGAVCIVHHDDDDFNQSHNDDDDFNQSYRKGKKGKSLQSFFVC